MKITETRFEGLLIIEPSLIKDDRGYFFEAYNIKSFLKAGLDFNFVQDNQSRSKQGVLRGLHFQRPPVQQAKLIRVLSGAIQDVIVDLRPDQPTFGQTFSIELSSVNNLQLLIPKGFANGFLVLSESAELFYKCDEFHHPEMEGGVIYNDPTLNIDWKIVGAELILSGRDKMHPAFSPSDFQ